MSVPRTQIDPLNQAAPTAPLGAGNPLNRVSLPPSDLKAAPQQAPVPSNSPLNKATLPSRDFLQQSNTETKIENVLVTPDLVGHLANLSHPSLLKRLEETNRKLRKTDDPALLKDYDYGLMTMDFNFRNQKVTPLAMPVVNQNGQLTVPADTKRRIEKESIARTFNNNAVKNA